LRLPGNDLGKQLRLRGLFRGFTHGNTVSRSVSVLSRGKLKGCGVVSRQVSRHDARGKFINLTPQLKYIAYCDRVATV
jgi:hypothetical protein